MPFPLAPAPVGAAGHELISSPPCPTAFLKGCAELTGLLLSIQSMYMDQSRRDWHVREQPNDPFLQARPSDPDLRARSSDTFLRAQSPMANLNSRHPRSSPLPQTQWSEIPLSYRPPEWIDANPENLRSEPSPGSRVRRPISSPPVSLSGQPACEQHQRGWRRSRHLDDRPYHPVDRPRSQMMDFSLLYPQMGSHDDRFSTLSAPESLETTRSASQPASRSFWQPGHEGTDALLMGIPRSPTYPPSSSRQTRSSIRSDGAFDDPNEFHLFAQATAGLEPEPAFRAPNPSSSSSSQRHQQPAPEAVPVFHPDSQDYIVSPLEPETPAPTPDLRQFNPMPAHRRQVPRPELTSSDFDSPTTMQAYQQLATLPDNHSPPLRQRHSQGSSGPETWISSPGPRHMGFLHDGDASPINDDEELPDYASSQAQAQAAQRVDAARRARELQMRWLQSNRREG